MSNTPTHPFVSKLKSKIAATQQEVTDLEEDKASLQQQNSDLAVENAALKRQLQILSSSDGSTAAPVDFDRIIALENELRRVNADFREFVVEADDKVNKEKILSIKLAGDLKEEKQYSANLERQVEDGKATQKSLRAQKTQAEKKAKDADAKAAKCEKDYGKAADEKRKWEAKYKREVMSKGIDGGKAAKSSINGPKVPTKTGANVGGISSKSSGSSKPPLSKIAGKHTSGPPSKHPFQDMARLSIGSSTDQPYVVDDDEDEDDIPLMQRKVMSGRTPGKKRKATVLQQDDDEDMDDEEIIPMKRERRE